MSDDIRRTCDIFYKTRHKFLDKKDCRALIEWVESESKRLGMAVSPQIMHIEHNLPMAAGGFVQMKGSSQWIPSLVITEGALKKIFNSPNLSHHVPDGLKAILGHEMSHVLEGKQSLSMRSVPLFALPLLSIIGYELYKGAQKRHEEDPSKTLEKHLDEVTRDEKHKSKSHDEQSYRQWEGPLLEWSKRVAIVGGGLVAGGMISRQIALSSEFAADRAGIIASRNPKAFIDTLVKFEKHIGEIVGPQTKKWLEDMSKRDFMDNVKQIYALSKLVVTELTYGAHPSRAARFKAIREFSTQQGIPLH